MEKGMKVMVVDDDPQMARTLCDILNLEGYRTDRASSGEEASIRLESVQADCILMDLKMPGMDGIDSMRLIKRSFPGIPVLLMSASVTEEQLEAADMGGAYTVLKKPLDILGLLFVLSGLGTRETTRWKRTAY